MMKEQHTALSRGITRLFILAALALLVSGCGLEAPQSPTWDTTLTIPLINRNYSSAELIEKLASDNINIDAEGNSTIRIEKNLDTVTIESILAVDEVSANYAKQIGRIKIVSPQDQQQSLAFADYVTLELGSIPAVGVTANTYFGETSSFTQAQIDEATVTITLTNNTGFALDSLSGRLLNHADGSLLGNFVVPGGLSDADSYSQPIVLDGKTVGAQVDCELYFHTVGGPALSLADRSIDLKVDYSDDVYVSAVYGKFDSFSKDYTQRTKIADDLHIATATLASGQMQFQAHNSLSLQLDLDVAFPEITKDGAPLQVSASMLPGDNTGRLIDLNGWTIAPGHDSILTTITATVPGTNNGYVSIDAEDEISVDFILSDLNVSSASAIVPTTELAIEPSEVAVEIPTGFENISLDLVELNVALSNYTELSGNVVIDLEASNGKSLQVLGTVSPRNGNGVSINEIYSDQLADLLTPIPDHISVSGHATVGDGVSTISISQSDYFAATAVISSPMAFRISQATVQGEKNKLEVDQDVADGADRLNHGVFTATMHNHLPLGAQMRVYIGTDSTTLFSSPLTIIGPLSFDRGTVDGNGAVNQEAVTTSEVTLTNDDLQVFTNRKLYVAPVLELSGSNGQVVRIRAADYMQINGVISINARVGGEE